MDRVLTAKQMIDADRYNIDKLGLSEDILVERAGEAVAEEIISRFKGGRVLVCVGKGNNGADGKVAAKVLTLKHGFNVKVFSVFDDNIELFIFSMISFILPVGNLYVFFDKMFVQVLCPLF